MSFFIFKSSYSLIFIHMHIDFHLVVHNIFISCSLAYIQNIAPYCYS